MATAVAGRSPADELLALQDRFHLLEGDRKAFYEKSQAELRENKSQQEELRNDNKLLRGQIGKLQKEHSGKEGGPGAELHEHELQKLEHQHNVLRQRHNALASANRDRELLADQLADQLRDLQRDSKRPAAQETPLTRQIRILENRLDKAMIKYNEAMSIKKTYEQIVKRLKEERVNFDHQLQAIEETLRAKTSDHEELFLMANDANHARDLAKQELAKQEALALEERRHRESELRSRRTLVEAQKSVMSRMDVRDKHRTDLILEAKGDLDEAQEERLREEVLATQVSRAVVEGAAADEAGRVLAFQAAFRRIKEATGISALGDVILKFQTQEQTLAALKVSTDEAQAKLDALSDECTRARSQLEELKFAGGTGMGGRQEVEAAERRLSEAMAAHERAKARFERLSKALVDMRAGVEHLSAKLDAGIRRDEGGAGAGGAGGGGGNDLSIAASLAQHLTSASGGEGGSFGAGASARPGAEAGGGPGPNGQLLETLQECEAKLLRLLEATHGRGYVQGTIAYSAVSESPSAAIAAVAANGGLPLPRPLPLPRAPPLFMALSGVGLGGPGPGPAAGGREAEAEAESDGSSSSAEADSAEVLDRETMKRVHGSLVDKAAAKGKRRRKPQQVAAVAASSGRRPAPAANTNE